MNLKYITRAGIIAAIYATLTIVFAPISYGQIQVRVSEGLTVLPFFTSAAIPGLTLGCIVANIYGGNGLIDIIFGSFATLIAALITRRIKKKILVPIPPILINALIIGFVLSYLYELPIIASIVWVGLGELTSCCVIGYPLIKWFSRYNW